MRSSFRRLRRDHRRRGPLAVLLLALGLGAAVAAPAAQAASTVTSTDAAKATPALYPNY